MTRRSVLFTPGDRGEMQRKAVGFGADAVVFDLEDGVAPGEKVTARETVRETLAAIDPDCEVCVRVNVAPETAAADLDAVLDGSQPDSVMLPKAAGPGDVERLADLLDERDADLPVLALIESAAGVLSAREIAAVEATDALLFGAEDLAADTGALRTDEGTEVLTARSQVVLAAAAEEVDAIDTHYPDVGDTDGLAEDARFALQLGYDGKMALHPEQVRVINEAFTPDSERVEWAQRILDAEAAADTEAAVLVVDGEMVDAPQIKQARRIVERARAGGHIE